MSAQYVCDACGETSNKQEYKTHTKWLSNTERIEVGFCKDCNNKFYHFNTGVAIDIFINSIINDCELCSDCGECDMPNKVKALKSAK